MHIEDDILSQRYGGIFDFFFYVGDMAYFVSPYIKCGESSIMQAAKSHLLNQHALNKKVRTHTLLHVLIARLDRLGEV